MAVLGEPHPALKPEPPQSIPWLWRSTPLVPAPPDPMDARMKTLSKQCEGNALDVEEEAMGAETAPGPIQLAPSAAVKATMTKSAETDLWVLSEAVALLPAVRG